MSQAYFRPKYCPNPKCCHNIRAQRAVKLLSPLKKEDAVINKVVSSFSQYFRSFCKRKGLFKRLDGSQHQRFICKKCKAQFSDSTFHLNYRYQIRGHTNAGVFAGVIRNQSNRSIARDLETSECLVRTRLLRLSQTALLKHFENIRDLFIKEDIAFDGLEAFAHSQYEPNNINQCVGADSLFCYLFIYSPLNRKGRISPRQREYLDSLESEKGRFDPQATRKASAEIFKELVKMKDPEKSHLVLRSDEHFHYKKALKRDLTKKEREKIAHQTVSSKATRNYKNILFSVNHLDMLIRREVAAFTRETICFSKKPSRMYQKYILYICYKNYMKPRFVKKQKNDPLAHIESPAMRLGIYKHKLEFGEFFNERFPNPNLEELPLDWALCFQDKVGFERSKEFKSKKTKKDHKVA